MFLVYFSWKTLSVPRETKLRIALLPNMQWDCFCFTTLLCRPFLVFEKKILVTRSICFGISLHKCGIIFLRNDKQLRIPLHFHQIEITINVGLQLSNEFLGICFLFLHHSQKRVQSQTLPNGACFQSRKHTRQSSICLNVLRTHITNTKTDIKCAAIQKKTKTKIKTTNAPQ
jgi:hypothetical protein